MTRISLEFRQGGVCGWSSLIERNQLSDNSPCSFYYSLLKINFVVVGLFQEAENSIPLLY